MNLWAFSYKQTSISLGWPHTGKTKPLKAYYDTCDLVGKHIQSNCSKQKKPLTINSFSHVEFI